MEFTELIVATSNPNKVKEIETILGRPVHRLDIDLAEIQAVDVEEVIGEKARAAYAATGRPVLVEDTALYLNAWNGLPGALIRWFLSSVGNQGICRMLDAFADRGAEAKTCLGLFDGEQVHIFRGVVRGRIASQPRGAGGFGWDKIFIPDGWEQTFGEAGQAAKDAISMRRKAVEELRAWLDSR